MGFDLFARVIIGFILFVRNIIGVVQTPYETYRNLSKGNHPEQLIPLVLIVCAYFAWSALVRHGIRANPMLLTYSFSALFMASIVTFGLVVGTIVVAGRLFHGTGSFRTVVLPWGYSLTPTIMWFWITSMLWVVFPPPRTGSVAGQLLSFVFIITSLFLFFWKGVLYYLTLRFGMKLDLVKILGVSAVIFPMGALYAIIMYRLGIFRIPFI